jgi:hypothetical protein
MNELDELKFEQKCEEFFKDVPIKFKAKKGNRLEEQMQKIIKKLNITIPIISIRGSLFLIGSIRSNCEIKLPDQVMIKVTGGTSQKLEKYLAETQKEHQKTLWQYMVQS